MKKQFLLVLLTVLLVFNACGKKATETENVEEPVAEETVVEEEATEIEDNIPEEPEEETQEKTLPTSMEENGWQQIYNVNETIERTVWEKDADIPDVWGSYEKHLVFEDDEVAAGLTVPYYYIDNIFFNTVMDGTSENRIIITNHQFGSIEMYKMTVTDEMISEYDNYTETDWINNMDISIKDGDVEITNTDEVYQVVLDIEKQFESSEGAKDGNCVRGKIKICIDKINHVGAFFHICDIVKVGETSYTDIESFNSAKKIVDENYDEETIKRITDSIKIVPVTEKESLANTLVDEYVEPETKLADVTITYVNEGNIDLTDVKIFSLGEHTDIDFGSIPVGGSSSVVLNLPVNEQHWLDAEYDCADGMLPYWASPMPPFKTELTIYLSNIEDVNNNYNILICGK